MKLSLSSFRKQSATSAARGDLTPKVTKATSKDDARPVLGTAHLAKDGDGYALLATDGYIMAKVPIEVEREGGDEPVVGPIPPAAMKHIESLPSKGLKAVWSFFEAREDVVQVGEDTTYKRRDVMGEPPKFEKTLEDARDITKPLTLGFDAVLLKNLADALGAQQLKVTIDLNKLDTPEGGGAQYLRALVVEPMNARPGGDGRVGLQMPVRVQI
jgi:hypothetical protein